MNPNENAAPANSLGNSSENAPLYDVVVIGAGVHGASMASEAASRGLKTLVVQSGHLGGASSCVPSDIVGLGINELENLQLAEIMTNRSELQSLHKKAPHLVRPRLAKLIKNPDVRSSRRISLGANIYNALQSTKVDVKEDTALNGSFDVDAFEEVFVQEYSINYTRIVVALLQQFEKYKGDILARQRVVKAQREQKEWLLELKNKDTNDISFCRSKTLINCTGSFTNNVLEDVLGVHSRSAANVLYSAQLYVKFPQHWEQVAVLQRENRSLVYAHNFDHEHLCIGPILADSGDDSSKEKAIEEVLTLWNEQTQIPLKQEDIVFCCWSAHPLVEDPASEKLNATNTCLLDLNNPGKAAPLLSLFGNSLVRYHKLAEQGLDILQPFTGAGRNKNFRTEALPGGDFSGSIVNQDTDSTLKQLRGHYEYLDEYIIERLVFTYGTNALDILDNAHEESELGQHFGHGLYQREVDYLIEKEWAKNADDILWRRTYLGLVFSGQEKQALEIYLEK